MPRYYIVKLRIALQNPDFTGFLAEGLEKRNFACIFPRPFGTRKNTTQLAKYPRVLYVKPSNKMYVHRWVIASTWEKCVGCLRISMDTPR